MIVYDFEVFKYNWIVVTCDLHKKEFRTIKDDTEELTEFFRAHEYDIWVGFNSRHYDQYILKGILAGFDPAKVNHHIIVEKKDGWQFSPLFNRWKVINYDVMPSPPIGLKVLEGFLGSDIRESDVSFNLDRPLTDKELDQVEHYCRHDVEETIKVFSEKLDDFNAMFSIVQCFNLPLQSIGKTEAQITAEVLQCVKREFDDEFDYFFLPCLRLEKYREVMNWFKTLRTEAKELNLIRRDAVTKRAWSKSKSLEIEVAGVPHTFGFGGLHGAPKSPIYRKGLILHIDVGSYYPSMLIAWDLITRAATEGWQYKRIYDTRMELKDKQVSAATKEESKKYKKAQLPYKKMLNALSGAMKDQYNAAYDPRNNNIMCINGQLMLLDLIEHLEEDVLGFELIQSNTDGLIIMIPDSKESFDAVDDTCYEWECRCSTPKCNISLALDTISEIYQKDVNNYLWIEDNGKIERKGAYVKELSRLDNDLPVINRALVEYMARKIPVEETIRDCDELIQFQKVVKLSEAYSWVEHEHGNPTVLKGRGKNKKDTYFYSGNKKYEYKSYRVFASSDMQDGRILKCGGTRGKPEKFADTPDHCFIWNDSVEGVKAPEYLDKEWYIALAKKRLKQFGV